MDTSNWPSLLKAVQSPLGFFTLVILIAASIFSLGSAITDRIPVWVPFSLFVLAIACVFGIVMKNPQAIQPQPELSADLKLVVRSFEGVEDRNAIYPDQDKCFFEIRDGEGSKRTCPAHVTDEPGGWCFSLREKFEFSDSVTLKIVETEKGDNRNWKVNGFYPNHHSRDAFLMK